MRMSKILILSAALAGGCVTAERTSAPVEPHPDTPAYAWKPVFAKDLSDAEFAQGAWAWEGDVLRSKLDKPIWTKADYENYVLDFEYRMEKDGNSGVFIYISNLDQFPKYKIEVQLLDDDSPKFKGKELAYQQTGSLYGRAAAKEVTSRRAGEWNRMTVFCQGKSVHVVHNGKAVVDANLDDWTDPLVNPDGTPVPPWHRGFPALSTIPTKGRVGFQGIHGEAGVAIRNLRIASLGGSCARPKMKLGCQLWGVKDFWYDKADKLAAFAEIFPKVKAMGYDGVQCGSFIRVDADGLEKLLKANGLAVADQPIAFDDVEDPAKLAQTVAFCNRFNVSFLYIPYFKGKTADEWRAFCRRLDSAEEKLRPHGIRVGYHHHDHELNEKVDGVLPWDILTGKDGARLELDIGPVLDTDHVPAAEIAKMSGRVPGIHAKPVGATAAGASGEKQDWAKVLAAADKAGVTWCVIECEQRQNTFEDITASAKYLRPMVDLVNALR